MWKSLKKFTTLEIIALIVFVIYLLFNIQLPTAINQLIDTSFGVVVVLVLTLWVFLSTNPIVGVVAIFVAYELVRRSSAAMMDQPRVAMIQYNPIQIKRDIQIADMNTNLDVNVATAAPLEPTLEEEVVKQMAPLSSGAPKFIETGFKPIAESTHNASAAI